MKNDIPISVRAEDLRLGDTLVLSSVQFNNFEHVKVWALRFIGDDVEINDGLVITSRPNHIAVLPKDLNKYRITVTLDVEAASESLAYEQMFNLFDNPAEFDYQANVEKVK